MHTGVISDLTNRAVEVSLRYKAQLQESVQEHVARTLDVKSFVNKVTSQQNSPAYKVDISQAALQKSAALR